MSYVIILRESKKQELPADSGYVLYLLARYVARRIVDTLLVPCPIEIHR